MTEFHLGSFLLGCTAGIVATSLVWWNNLRTAAEAKAEEAKVVTAVKADVKAA